MEHRPYGKTVAFCYAIAILLSGCGPAPCPDRALLMRDYQEISPHVIDAIVASGFATQSVSAPTPVLCLVPEPKSCCNSSGCVPGLAVGCYDGYRHIWIAKVHPGRDDYDYRRVLLHELVHHFGLHMGGIASYDHSHPIHTEVEAKLRHKLFGIPLPEHLGLNNVAHVCTVTVEQIHELFIYSLTCRKWAVSGAVGPKKTIILNVFRSRRNNPV